MASSEESESESQVVGKKTASKKAIVPGAAAGDGDSDSDALEGDEYDDEEMQAMFKSMCEEMGLDPNVVSPK
jgi:hypothetical protein